MSLDWNKPSSGPAFVVAVGAVLVLAFLLRVVALDQGLWGDQITVYQLAQLDSKHLYENMMNRKELHPPLTYFLLHGWLRAGSSEAWARGLFVLFGVGTCAVTFGLGRALAGRRFGLMAMATTAILPAAVWASRFVRSYIIGAFFAGLAAWSFVRLLQGRRSLRDWAVYGAFSVLAVQTYYFNVLLLAAQGIYGLAVGWRRRGWVGPLVLVQGLAVASLLPLILPAIHILQTAWAERPTSTPQMLLHNVGFYIGGFHIGGLIRSLAGALGVDTLFMSEPLHRTWTGPLLGAVGLVALVGAVALLAWGSRWLNREGRREAGLASGTWVVAMLLVPVGLANALHNLTTMAMLPHYFVPLVPIAACLWAGAVAAMPRRWMAWAVAGLIVLFSGARLNAIYHDEGANWRQALPHLEARWEPGDGVLFLQPSLKRGYDFYSTRLPPQVGLDSVLAEAMNPGADALGSSDAARKMQSRLERFQRLWFLRTEPYHFEQERMVTAWVRSQYRPVDEQRFGQLVLTLLDRVDDTSQLNHEAERAHDRAHPMLGDVDRSIKGRGR